MGENKNSKPTLTFQVCLSQTKNFLSKLNLPIKCLMCIQLICQWDFKNSLVFGPFAFLFCGVCVDKHVQALLGVNDGGILVVDFITFHEALCNFSNVIVVVFHN